MLLFNLVIILSPFWEGDFLSCAQRSCRLHDRHAPPQLCCHAQRMLPSSGQGQVTVQPVSKPVFSKDVRTLQICLQCFHDGSEDPFPKIQIRKCANPAQCTPDFQGEHLCSCKSLAWLQSSPELYEEREDTSHLQEYQLRTLNSFFICFFSHIMFYREYLEKIVSLEKISLTDIQKYYRIVHLKPI